MRKNSLKYFGFIIFCLILFWPKPAYADVAIPMFFLTWESMVIALIPVVIIEAVVFIMMLKIDVWRAISASFWANAKSTVIGVPLSGILLFSVVAIGTFVVSEFKIPLPDSQLFSIITQAVWIIPTHDGTERYQSLAIALGLIPAYFLSIWIEFGVVKQKFQELDSKVLHKVVQIANLITYATLVFLCIFFKISTK